MKSPNYNENVRYRQCIRGHEQEVTLTYMKLY